MGLVAEKIKRLESLDIPKTAREDFDVFWKRAKERSAATPLALTRKEIDHPIDALRVEDITFQGLDGTPIHAWLVMPKNAKSTPLPVVVHYHGYTGSRGFPHHFSSWAMMGVATISFEFRMQGGLTGSNTGFAVGCAAPSSFVWGVLDKEESYLFHTTTDALRAVDVVKEVPELDANRVCVEGVSQGGGVCLTVAALHDDVALCMSDVPSNSWFEKRIMDESGQGKGLDKFINENPDLLDTVCDTLSYFDNINHAENITSPVFVSVGLKDPVCPAENAYAAYNKITAEKEIIVYPSGKHDGGRELHQERKLAYLKRRFFA